jgi:hypothetical protein
LWLSIVYSLIVKNKCSETYDDDVWYVQDAMLHCIIKCVAHQKEQSTGRHVTLFWFLSNNSPHVDMSHYSDSYSPQVDMSHYSDSYLTTVHR